MSKAARPVAFSLLIILLVYLPLMALEGVEGRMFKPMAITVALALGGALLFSLTAFPALAATLLAAASHKHDVNKGFFGRAATRAMTGSSSARSIGRKPVLAVAAAALVLDGRRRRRRWAPSSFRGWTRASCRSTSSGCRRSRSPRRNAWASRSRGCWRSSPRSQSIVTRTGRAEVATDPVGPDETEVMVKLRPKEEWKTAHDLDGLGRGDQAGGRGRGPRDLRVGVSADRGSREPAAGRLARRRRDQGVRAGSRHAEEDGRRDRQGRARHPGPRRLARPAGARAAAAGGQARSPAAGALRDERGPRAGGGRGVARRPLSRARSSRARGGSISCCCCRRRR